MQWTAENGKYEVENAIKGLIAFRLDISEDISCNYTAKSFSLTFFLLTYK